jgi:single-strand DNA-binding protein
MSDVNITVISGRLARKPELRHTPSGTAVTDFSVANNLRGKNGREKTIFMRCSVWNKAAEFVGTLDTGDHVTVQGELADDNYEQTKGDPSTLTRGRLKLDNCKCTLLRRKNGNGNGNTVTQTDNTVGGDMAGGDINKGQETDTGDSQ